MTKTSPDTLTPASLPAAATTAANRTGLGIIRSVLFRLFAGMDLAARVRAGLALRCLPGGQSPVGEYALELILASKGEGLCPSTRRRSLPQNSTTYEALSKLSAAPDGFEIRSAAIVERDKDGHLHVPEGGDTPAGAGIAGGSLIGMLIGVLGSPVGMLLGWSVGAASGAPYDADRLDKGDEAIEQFGALEAPRWAERLCAAHR